MVPHRPVPAKPVTLVSHLSDLSAIYSPGTLVRHPDRPEWGTGQVQSTVAHRVTVTFPEAGKVVIDASRVTLILVFP
jgi:hypothetical protein